MFRVDLTTSSKGDSKTLQRDFQYLRAEIEKKFGFYVEYFRVETSEGFGVYHMIWAIKWDKAVWIPQKWLSEEWEKIHGAKIVWISRMGKSYTSIKRVGRYFAVQYLAGQSSMVRISWSWWRGRLAIGKGWQFLKSQMMRGFESSTWLGKSPFERTITYKDLLESWDKILSEGICFVSNAVIFISGRNLDIGFKNYGRLEVPF
jgi:hypothetical protein